MEFDADADLSIDEPLTFDVPSESSIRRYGACLECQLRHIKCDGTYPCKACVGRKTKCMYKMKAPKRSSVSSQVEALRQQIKHMTESINRQMESTKRLQLQYEKVVREKEHADLKYGQRLAQDNLMTRFSEEYQHSAYIFMQIEAPADFSYLRRPDADQILVARTNALLGLGALMLGDHKYPQHYLGQARIALAEHFDQLDANVAATYHLMRSVCNVTGDFDAELTYSTSALKMSEMLLKKHKTKRIKGVDIGFIYDSSYGNSICQKDFASVEELHDMIHKLPKAKYAWFAAILMQKAFGRVLRAIHALSPELGNVPMVNRVLYKLGLARQLGLHSHFPVSYMLARFDATQAALFLFIGLDDLAEQSGLSVLERVRRADRHKGFNFFFITMSLFVTGQIFSYLNRKEYLEQTIKLMEQFNGAELAINLLRDPTTPVEAPSIYSYNFFFPKIEQFRYINISQTNFNSIRDQLLLDLSAVTLTAQNHVTNVGFNNYIPHHMQLVPEQTVADVGFIFSDNLLQVPSPPQTYHDVTGGNALHHESDKTSPLNSPNYATQSVNAVTANNTNYAANVSYTNNNTPPVTRVKHYYTPQPQEEETRAKRQRIDSYTPNTTVITHWHQYESRGAMGTPSNDEDSCAQPDVGSEEEYPSPEQQYPALLANTDVSQVPATLDQMALMMYYNQNLHANTRPSTQYDTRIQPLPSNSMYYNQ
eukprot:TRINITY_DN4096_c0_g1_i1.p1 TRINITY_DN4096_c0_g1~~TRINITY_DN4096_c0_g1_i1.p1  ORF type:complete len:709 (-),score=192.82 TRINITY_DN4096_c0_g1_i1:46-2172(-)